MLSRTPVSLNPCTFMSLCPLSISPSPLFLYLSDASLSFSFSLHLGLLSPLFAASNPPYNRLTTFPLHINPFLKFSLPFLLYALPRHYYPPSLSPIFFHSPGKYAFIDASSPRKPGEKAWYVSQDLSPHASPTCLTFWTNMNGATVGTLNVWVRQSSDASLRPVWSLAGAQGKDWFKAQASIPAQTGSYQVRNRWIGR